MIEASHRRAPKAKGDKPRCEHCGRNATSERSHPITMVLWTMLIRRCKPTGKELVTMRPKTMWMAPDES